MRLANQDRVEINDRMLKQLLRKFSQGKISELAQDIGLPYDLIYNLIYGRIKSLTAQHYALIFGEYPPEQKLKRVDGSYFRRLVRLWLFLNEDVTEADIYREFYRDKPFKKIDYRLFSGATKTIDKGLEDMMERKFFDQGCNRQDIKELLAAMVSSADKKRIPYQKVRPIVDYLGTTLQVSPVRILHQRRVRYEHGELKTVSKKVYDAAATLKKKAENAENSGSKLAIESIREEIYGTKKGYVLYSQIADELAFLQKYGDKSVRHYLGRSISYYKKSKLKRIADWRAQIIKAACRELIDKMPKLELSHLPKTQADVITKRLLSTLSSVAVSKIMTGDQALEKKLLAAEYRNRVDFEVKQHGLVSVAKTAYILGMSKMAFDLLVAMHSDVFRKIGQYSGQWFLPYSYIHELKRKKEFDFIKAKYEILAKSHSAPGRSGKHPTSEVNATTKSDPPKEKHTDTTEATANTMSCLPPEFCCHLN